MKHAIVSFIFLSSWPVLPFNRLNPDSSFPRVDIVHSVFHCVAYLTWLRSGTSSAKSANQLTTIKSAHTFCFPLRAICKSRQGSLIFSAFAEAVLASLPLIKSKPFYLPTDLSFQLQPQKEPRATVIPLGIEHTRVWIAQPKNKRGLVSVVTLKHRCVYRGYGAVQCWWLDASTLETCLGLKLHMSCACWNSGNKILVRFPAAMTHGGQLTLSSGASVPLFGNRILRNATHLRALMQTFCLLNGSRLWSTIVHGQRRVLQPEAFFFVCARASLSLWQAEDGAAVPDLFESILEHFLTMSHVAPSWNRTHIYCAAFFFCKRLSQAPRMCSLLEGLAASEFDLHCYFVQKTRLRCGLAVHDVGVSTASVITLSSTMAPC